MTQRPKSRLLLFCYVNGVKTLVTLPCGSPQGLIWHWALSIAWAELSSSMAIPLQMELALFQRPFLPVFLQCLLQKARHCLAIMSCPCACKHWTTIKWTYAFHSLRLKSVYYFLSCRSLFHLVSLLYKFHHALGNKSLNFCCLLAPLCEFVKH